MARVEERELSRSTEPIRAARIHRFGSPEVIQIDEVPCPVPGDGEVLARVANTGVGPWDALIREQKSVVGAGLPLMLDSDLSAIVETLGPDVRDVVPGDRIYGVINADFIGPTRNSRWRRWGGFRSYLKT